jgi:hypothetical protein
MHVNPRHHSFAVAPFRGALPGGPAPKRLNHFMIEVNSLDDVGYALALFQQRGIGVGQLGRHTNDRMLSFYGATPSGFMVEVGTGGRLIENEDEWEVQNFRATSFWGHDMSGLIPAPSAS